MEGMTSYPEIFKGTRETGDIEMMSYPEVYSLGRLGIHHQGRRCDLGGGEPGRQEAAGEA
jgi:hypothetical protein